jgi:threonylcarbamoyladenosine tRNA methylthiotransferase MtaB
MELQNNKFCLITLGCRVNVLESEKIINTLVDAGMEFVPDNSKEADIFVVNTCCVTNKAESKSRNDINTAIRLANKLVIVCGCYSQITDLKSLNEKVGIIIGSKYKFSLPELIKKYNGERIIKVDDLSKEDTFENYEDFHFVQHTRAFLKIQDGCNYNCSYCVIPLARGKQRSMKFENAIKIINNYIAKGFKEVVLTGVNTAGYNDNGQSFYDLLNTINKIEGDFRIRISSLEPFQITDEIIDLLTKNKQR